MAKAKSKNKNTGKTKPAKNKRTAEKARLKKSAAKTRRPAAKKAVIKKSRPQAKPVGGLPGQLHAAAMKILKERQAEDIVSVNLAGRSSIADYLIIASGKASRQIAAIADYLRKAFADLGAERIRIEGLPQGNWVLVDCGDVIVHLFRPEVRRFYAFDEIWEE